MTTEVAIISGALTPSVKYVKCRTVTVGFKRDVIAEPNANGGTLAEVQTQSQENLRYSINGAHLFSGTVASTIMTYTDWLTLAKTNYTGTNAALLRVVYGKATGLTTLANFAGTTTGIPVVLESYNASFDTADSDDAYRPVINVNFLETA